ncbi:MAG: GWxTD domain-containing protein [Bacteroidota bacterium]|nr:GWxTD domain-containing protein [Bacteroidota bacterium]
MNVFMKFGLALFIVSSLFSQQQNDFKLQYDIARFRGDDEHLYVEVYYAFDVSLLKYVLKNSELQSESIVSVTFKRSSDDSTVARQAWRIPFSVSDTMMLKSSRSYSDIFGFYLKPDIYRAYIVASDVNDPTVRDSISVLFDVKSFVTETIALSDVELCTSILPIERDSTNRFYKNTFEVKPNPTRMFGLHQPALFYYLETYNLQKKKSDNYYTKAIVTNAVGKEVINHEKVKRRINDSNVDVGIMKVNSLRSGVYTFTFIVIDSVDNSQHSSSKKFFIYNPTLPNDTLTNPSASNIDATEYATMSESELDKEYEQSRYISTKNEIDQYKKLKGVEAKRKAMFDFWTNRDEDRTTEQNEMKQEYFKRISIANVQYKTGFREGWKTDRGRIYVMYGAPDEVERHANEIDVKPYEIWFYNSIQGGVQFIFGDRSGFSDYVLLHSTHRNELHDDYWRKQIEAN